jgi:leucyl aminopeptidase
MITAGKFLEHFVKAPYVHLDIAGPSFLESPENYKGKGGTGVGVRLLHEFIEKHF